MVHFFLLIYWYWCNKTATPSVRHYTWRVEEFKICGHHFLNVSFDHVVFSFVRERRFVILQIFSGFNSFSVIKKSKEGNYSFWSSRKFTSFIIDWWIGPRGLFEWRERKNVYYLFTCHPLVWKKKSTSFQLLIKNILLSSQEIQTRLFKKAWQSTKSRPVIG